jgi:hypothetical protein
MGNKTGNEYNVIEGDIKFDIIDDHEQKSLEGQGVDIKSVNNGWREQEGYY